jgi:dTDP-4-amino-4,6-dideoxygalactose transaminase
MNIPFLNFEDTNKEVKDDLVKAFSQFIDSKWFVLGKELKSFEKEFAEYTNLDYCAGVGNGLDAITLSLMALGVSEGDEVIVPSNTYIATVLSVTKVGAKPVFVEPDVNTYNLDPLKIEEKITHKTKAILPVHLYGQPCDMNLICEIAKKHNLFIVEDNAQSQGALLNGIKTGSFGDINATSFYPSKNLGGYGDGGAITTNNLELYNKVLCLRNYGSEVRYYNKYKGVNSRLDELQASLLKVKLKKLDYWNNERARIAEAYNERLKGLSNIILPNIIKGASSVYHIYLIRTLNLEIRDGLKSYLADKGVGTLIHYPVPPHLQEAYADLGYSKGDFPIAEHLANTSLSLPIYYGLKVKEIDYICNQIISFYS